MYVEITNKLFSNLKYFFVYLKKVFKKSENMFIFVDIKKVFTNAYFFHLKIFAFLSKLKYLKLVIQSIYIYKMLQLISKM